MKTLMKSAMAFGLIALVSACATAPTAPYESRETAKQAPVFAPQFKLAAFHINVPRSLEVSEANSYYPGGDIVWREDPIGDRYQQVRSIFEAGLAQSRGGMKGATPVNLHIEVERFHALTEKARYTIGGVHSITFVMTMKNPATGAVIGTPKRVRADLDAFGGLQAIRAENQGITQKSRITEHLAFVIQQEFNTAEGYQNKQLGFYQAVNNL